MMRLIVILTVAGYLTLSHSAKGESHAEGGSGNRQKVEVPAISSGERLSELTNACSVGRPFPPLKTKWVEIEGSLPGPVGETAPDVPDAPPGAIADGAGAFGGAAGAGSSLTGSAVFARCTKCHDANALAGEFKSLEEVRTRTNPGGGMPQGGTPLTSSEQADLLAYLKQQGLQ